MPRTERHRDVARRPYGRASGTRRRLLSSVARSAFIVRVRGKLVASPRSDQPCRGGWVSSNCYARAHPASAAEWNVSAGAVSVQHRPHVPMAHRKPPAVSGVPRGPYLPVAALGRVRGVHTTRNRDAPSVSRSPASGLVFRHLQCAQKASTAAPARSPMTAACIGRASSRSMHVSPRVRGSFLIRPYNTNGDHNET